MSIYFQMKKVLFFVAYLCLFFLTSVTLWAIHVAAGSGSYSKGITYDCWNKAVEEIETEWYDLHYPDPYWGAPFYHNDSRLSDQTLLVRLPKGGARYTAIWHESKSNSYSIEYYQDKNGRCLPDCAAGTYAYLHFSDCSYWYTLSRNGLVVLDIHFVIIYFCYIFTLFALPPIVWLFALYKIVFYTVSFIRTHQRASAKI